MSGYVGKNFDKDKRAEFINLLSQGAAVDPDAWQLFWQNTLGEVTKGNGQDMETLISIFEEGVSEIIFTNIEVEDLIGTWVREIIRVAKSWGVDQTNFS